MKIKKQQENKHLEVPEFERNLQQPANIQPFDLEDENQDLVQTRHEDELELTKTLVTTELDLDNVSTDELDTLDLKEDIEQIQKEHSIKMPDPSSVKVASPRRTHADIVENEEVIEGSEIRREVGLDKRIIALLIIVIAIIIGAIISFL